MARHTIGFAELAELGIPHSLGVVMAMSEMPDHFPRPVNGKHAKVPLWDRSAVERFYAQHFAPDGHREPIGSAKWWDA